MSVSAGAPCLCACVCPPIVVVEPRRGRGRGVAGPSSRALAHLRDAVINYITHLKGWPPRLLFSSVLLDPPSLLLRGLFSGVLLNMLNLAGKKQSSPCFMFPAHWCVCRCNSQEIIIRISRLFTQKNQLACCSAVLAF